MDLIQIGQLRDYSQCPAYAKFNWSAGSPSYRTITENVIRSCYMDLAVNNKKVDWRTVRNRVHHQVLLHSEELNANQIYKLVVLILDSIKKWYLEEFRDGEEEGLVDLRLELEINKTKVEVNIDGLLVEGNKITLVDFTEKETTQDILRDIGLRTKVLALSKQNITVNKVLSIKCSDRSVRCTPLKVDNIPNWNYKNEQILQLMLLGMKQKIFYPSPTSMCSTCKYKDICT
jgi:hypothetical protein